MCCGCVSCLGCNLIKMCEECNLSPSDLFYSLAANMAGLSAILQFQLAHNLGAAAKPLPLIGQLSPSLASDWLVRPLTGHNIGAQFTRVERQQCAALYDQATSPGNMNQGENTREEHLMKRIVLTIGREMETDI